MNKEMKPIYLPIMYLPNNRASKYAKIERDYNSCISETDNKKAENTNICLNNRIKRIQIHICIFKLKNILFLSK